MVEFDEFKYDVDIREGLKNKEVLVKSVFDLIYDNEKNQKQKNREGLLRLDNILTSKNFPLIVKN